MLDAENKGKRGMMSSSPAIRLLDNPIFHRFIKKYGEVTSLNDLGFSARRYMAHTSIARQGEREDRVFIIHSGWGCLYKDLPDGERQIIDFTLIGDAVSLQSTEAEAQSSFTSITDLAVFEARAASVLAAIGRTPPLAETLLAASARQRRILVEHMTNLGRRTALVRTAHLLLELWTRLEAAGMADSSGYDCPLTQYDLADALGLTAIHVNRMLRELREHGFLSIRKGRVEFIEIESVIEFADFDKTIYQN